MVRAFTFLFFILPQVVAALTYQGRLIDDFGDYQDDGTAEFKFQIYSENGECLLYEESHPDVDMTDTLGFFNIRIGTGIQNIATAPNFTLHDAMSNNYVLSDESTNCVPDYSPTISDQRLLKVFIDGVELTPTQVLDVDTYSYQVNSVTNLQDKKLTDFIENTGSVTQETMESLAANESAILDLLDASADPAITVSEAAALYATQAFLAANHYTKTEIDTTLTSHVLTTDLVANYYDIAEMSAKFGLKMDLGDQPIPDPLTLGVGDSYSWDGSAWQPFEIGTGTGLTGVVAGGGLTGGSVPGINPLDIGIGDGITVNADDIAINNGNGLQFNAGALEVASGVTTGLFLIPDDIPQCTAVEKLQWTALPIGGWSCVPDADSLMSGTDILAALAGDDGAGSGLDADLLDGNDSPFYLDYANFTNTPTIYTQTQLQTSGSASVHYDNLTSVPAGLANGDDDLLVDLGCADDQIVKTAAGAWQCDTDQDNLMSGTAILAALAGDDGAGSGLDADLLDGNDSPFYLDYNNFTNTPSIYTQTQFQTSGQSQVHFDNLTNVPTGLASGDSDLITTLGCVNDDVAMTLTGAWACNPVENWTTLGSKPAILADDAVDWAELINKPVGIDDQAVATAITIDAAGNVGIGDTTPSVPLDVNGGIRAVEFCDETGSNCRDVSTTWTNGTVTDITAGNGLLGGTITSVGTIDVDSGTTAGKIIQLDGSARIPAIDGSLVTSLDVGEVQSAAGKYFSYLPNNVACVDGQILDWDDTNSRWVCDDDGNTVDLPALPGTALAPGYAFSSDTASGMYGPAVGELGFSTSGAEAIRIDGSGNVGIGLVPSSAKLEVDGSVLVAADGSAAAPSIRINNNNTGLFQPGLDQVAISNDGGESLRIDDQGRVGIGATSVGANLQVGDGSAATGVLLMGPDTNANSSKIYFGGDSGGTAPGYSGMSVGYDSNAQLLKLTDELGSNVQMVFERDSGFVGIGTETPASNLSVAGDLQIGADAAACDGTKTGAIRYNAGIVEYCNGTIWDPIYGGSNSIISLNGDAANTQSFAAPGSSGLTPNFATAGGVHTLHIPLASTASVTAGSITKTEYDDFNNKQTSTLADGTLLVGNGSNVPTSVTMSGDTSMTNTGAVTVSKLQGTDVSTTAPTTTGQVFRWNNGGSEWEAGVDGSVLIDLNASNLSSGTIAAARIPGYTGDLTSSAGSTALTLSNTAVTPGTYHSVTVDAKGRTTAGTNPTTLAGYGITDAVSIGGDTMTGTLNLPSNGLAVNTDELVVSSGRLGVGVASPDTNLQIGDGSAATSMLMQGPDTNANSSKIYFGGDSGGTAPGYSGMSVGYDSDAQLLKLTDELGSNVQMVFERDSGFVGIGTETPASNLSVAGDLQIGADAAACDGTKTGAIRYNAGIVEYCNGTIWDPIYGGSNSIISLNGDAANTQSFAAPGSSGLTPNFATAGGVHTLHIPLASTASVTAGSITKTEYDDFNNKQTSTLADGTLLVGNGSNVPTSVTMSGDTSMTNTGAVTVSKLQGTDVSTTAPTTTGQVFRWNNGGSEWEAGVDGSVLIDLNASNLSSGTIAAARIPGYTGDLTSSAGSTALTLSNTAVTPGTYHSVTVDAKGRTTAGTNPTTLAGYGITDAVSIGGDTMTGTLNLPSNGLAVNTDELVVSSGRLGVGVASPDTDLQVGDGTATADVLLRGPGTNATSSIFYFGGGSGAAPAYTGMSIGYDSLGHELEIVDQSGSNTRMVIERDTGFVGIGTEIPASRLQVAGGMQIGSDAATCDGTKVGTLRYNAGDVDYCNGTAWDRLYASSDNIQSINGATESTQSFAVPGSTGLAPNFTESGGVHTLHIPLASTASVTAGSITKTEYDDFNNKQTSTLADGTLLVGNGSNVPTSVTMSGDSSMTNAGVVTVSKLQGTDVSTTAPTTTGQVFRWNNGGSEWEAGVDGSVLIDLNASNLSSGTIAAARIPGYTGDLTSSAGSTALTLSNTAVTPGTYHSVTVDAKGRTTAGTNPTTLAGYGITDAVSIGGDTMTGTLNLPSNGLAVNTDELVVSSGRLGVGVASPDTNLQIGDGSAATSMLMQGPDTNANSSKIYFGGDSGGTAPGYSGMSVGYDSNAQLLKLTDELGSNVQMVFERDSGFVGIGTETPASNLSVAGDLQIGADAAACDGTKVGAIRYNAGVVEYCNGTIWDPIYGGSNSISSLNGATETTQSFAVPGSTGLAPNFTESGGVHTLHVPLASTASVTAGSITKTEYDDFNNKQTSTLADGTLLVGNGSNVPTSVTMSGDTSMTNTGAVTVSKLQGTDVSTTAPTTTGQVFRWNNGGSEWEAGVDGSVLIDLNASNLSSGTIAAARIPGYTGDLTSSAGSTALTLSNTAVTPGTYHSVTVDAKGRTTAGTNPTTLAGYGITDAVSIGGDTMTGTLNLPSNGLAVNTDELVVSSGRLGVGVASPDTDLQVGDGTATADVLLRGPGTNATSSIFYFGGGSGAAPAYTGMSIGYDSLGHELEIVDQSGSNTRMVIERDTGFVGIGTQAPASMLQVAGGLQIGSDASTCDGTKVGTLRYNSGTTEYCNGTSWDPLYVGGNTVESLNGATETTQSFAVPGSTGLAPNFTESGGVHTLHIPLASTASVTAGSITKTEYDDFNNKQTSTLADGTLLVGNGSNVPTSVTMSGDSSMTNAGVVTVSKLQGTDVSTTAPTTTGQIFRWNNGGSEWEAGVDGSVLIDLNASNLSSGTIAAARIPGYTGDLTSSAGSTALTLSNTAVTPGTYHSVTVDAKGRTTAGTNPTTLAGYGITDAVSIGGDTMTGTLNLPSNGLAVNTDELVVSSGRLGVGVASPDTNLQVGDGSAATDVLLRGPAATADSSIIYFGGGSGAAPAYTGISLGYDTIGQELEVVDQSGSNTRMVIERDTGFVGIGTQAPASMLQVAGGLQIGSDASTCDGTKVGTLRYNSGTTEYCNGTAWDPLYVSGNSIETLNGADETSQSFAVPGSAGLAPNFTESGGVHTLHIPLASTASVTAGSITKTEYDDFNNKQTSTLADGTLLVGNGSNVPTSVTMSGDSSMTNAGVVTVSKLQGTDVSTTAPTTTGQVFRWNNGGSEWEAGVDGSVLIDLNASNLSSGTIAAARIPGYTGDLTSSAGSTALTLSNTAVTPGIYHSVTVDAKGRTTAGTNPTTLAGYGITDAVSIGGDTMTGTLNLPSNGLAVNTDELAVSSGRLGVGVASPDTDLQVGDGTATAEVLLRGPDTDATSSIFYFGGGSGAAPAYTGMSIGYDSTAEEMEIVDQNGSNVRMVIERDTGFVGVGTQAPASMLQVAGGLQIGSDAATCDGTKAGTLRYNAGTTEYCNGTIWDPLYVSGNAVETLNGADEVSQSFAVPGTTGLSPNWSESAGVHTVNIPDASAAGVTAGTLNKTKYDDFDNRLTSTLADGTILVGNGSNVPVSVAMSGDSTIANTGAITIEKLQGVAVTSTAPSVEGQMLRWNNGSSYWEPSTDASQLVNLNASNLGSGTIPAARMPEYTGDLSASAGTTALTLANTAVTPGTYHSVTVDAKGRTTAGTNPTTLAGYGITDALEIGGDTMTGTLNMASNGLVVGTDQLTVSSGNVGIGVASPDVDLQIGDASAAVSLLLRGPNSDADSSVIYFADNAASSPDYNGISLDYDTVNQRLEVVDRSGSSTQMVVERDTGYVGIGTDSPQAMLSVNSGIQVGTDAAACNATKGGTLRYNGGIIEFCDDTNWEPFFKTGDSVESLNGSSENSQTLAVGTSGLAPNWATNVGAGSHTIHFPLASTASVTAGLISNTEFTDFESKQVTPLTSGNILVGNSSNVATSVSVNGDMSITNTGVTTITDLRGSSVSTTAPTTTGQVLRWNNGGSEYEASVDGSTVTALNASALATGTVSAARLPAYTGDLTSSAGTTALTLANTAVTPGTYHSVTVDAKGRTTAGTNPTTLAGYGITDGVLLAGDTMSGTLNLPSDGLVVGTDQLIIANSGNIGVGLASPSLDVGISGNATASIAVERHSSGAGQDLDLNSGGAASGVADLDGGDLVLASGVATGSGSSKIVFNTATSGSSGTSDVSPDTKMTIFEDGTVGIGVSSADSQLHIAGGLQVGTDGASCDGTKVGTTRYNSGSIEFCDGSTWNSINADGDSIVNLNGSGEISQSFSTPGTAGTAPAWTTNAGAGTHLIDIPLAANAGVTQGLISKTKYDEFDAKIDSSLTNGQVLIGNGSNVYAPHTLSGDLTMTNTGDVNVTGMQGYDMTASGIYVDGWMLRWSNTFSRWEPSINASLITNVNASALSSGSINPGRMPAFTGGDLTSSAGSVVLNLQNSGITAGDYRSVTVNAKGYITAGSNPTGTLASFSITDGANIAGDTLTGTLNLASNGLVVGTDQLYVDSGNVGIGTSSPNSKLHVSSGMQVGTDSATCDGTKDGTLRYSGGTIQVCKSSTWTSLTLAGSVISAFNGTANATNSFATPTTTGTAISWSTNLSSGAHTLNIPLSGTTVPAGLMSKTDYDDYSARIENDGGVPSFESGTDAGKPTAGTSGRIYVTTDTDTIYRDNGTSWETLSSTQYSNFVNSSGNAVFPSAACPNSHEYLVFNSTTDKIECHAMNATDVGTALSFTAMDDSGDTMTGTLNLPSNGLVVGTTELVVASGSVGIGTASPGYPLEVVGSAGKSTGTAWTNTSDARLKNIRGQYVAGIDQILQLDPVRYNYKKNNLGLPDDIEVAGFVAQDVERAIPEAVIKRDDGFLSLDVDPIHWAKINAIQDVSLMCEDLKTKIAEIRQKNDQVKGRNDRLRARNQLLKKVICGKLNPTAKVCRN